MKMTLADSLQSSLHLLTSGTITDMNDLLDIRTGATGTKTLALLSPAETNLRLSENQASFAVSRRGNPVLRYDTNHLASNSPIEDDSCCVILERENTSGGASSATSTSTSAKSVKGDLVFWGVFGEFTFPLISSSKGELIRRMGYRRWTQRLANFKIIIFFPRFLCRSRARRSIPFFLRLQFPPSRFFKTRCFLFLETLNLVALRRRIL